jgi:uncharacterized membrane protein
VFDVSSGPVRVQANPGLKSYWSIALYAANSDNFFVVNDQQARDKPVDLWLVSEGANAQGQTVAPGSTVVVSPSKQGFLLMRVLTGDYAAEKAVVGIRKYTISSTRARAGQSRAHATAGMASRSIIHRLTGRLGTSTQLIRSV